MKIRWLGRNFNSHIRIFTFIHLFNLNQTVVMVVKSKYIILLGRILKIINILLQKKEI